MMELRYLGLVGKVIDARRPAEAGGEEYGGAGLVARIESARVLHEGAPGIQLEAVDICFDYGMGFRVTEADERRWSFTVYPDEDTYDLFNPHPGALTRRLEVDEVVAELNRLERFGVEFGAAAGYVTMSPSSARALLQWMRRDAVR